MPGAVGWDRRARSCHRFPQNRWSGTCQLGWLGMCAFGPQQRHEASEKSENRMGRHWRVGGTRSCFLLEGHRDGGPGSHRLGGELAWGSEGEEEGMKRGAGRQRQRLSQIPQRMRKGKTKPEILTSGRVNSKLQPWRTPGVVFYIIIWDNHPSS